MSDYRIRLSELDFRLRLTADPGLEDQIPKALESAARFFLELEPTSPAALFETRAGVHRVAAGWKLVLDSATRPTYRDINDAMRSIEFELERLILERPSPRLMLHAGSVVRGGYACAFMASPDRGKTTSALHCLELGAELLSEEVTTVDADTFEIAPHLRSLSTGPAHIRRLDERFPLTAGRLEVLTQEEARYLPARLRRTPAPLRMIVIPTYDRDSIDELAEVAPAEVLTEMLGYCFEPRQDHERFVDCLIALLGRCRIMKLRYTGGESARTMLAEISERLDKGR